MISVHWIPAHAGQVGDTTDTEVFAHWQPAFVKIVCVDERPPYTERIPASAVIVVRNHPMSEMGGKRGFASGAAAIAAGNDHAATCERMAVYLESKGVARNRMAFEGLNEPHLWADEPPKLTATYYQTFLNGLHGHRLRGVIGNFGVGWPGNGGVQDAPVDWEFFRAACGAMQAGDYLGLHEYWNINGPNENWRWWGGRFLQCPFRVPILVTECGVDTGVVGQWYGGWRDMLPGTSFDDKAFRYVEDLWWYAKQCAADGRVKGIFPFTYDCN